jgi:hypothetical protein
MISCFVEEDIFPCMEEGASWCWETVLGGAAGVQFEGTNGALANNGDVHGLGGVDVTGRMAL